MTSTEQQTETLQDAAPDVWPPLAHIAEKPIREGGKAICGAKLMGMELSNASKVCPKCVEIAKGGLP